MTTTEKLEKVTDDFNLLSEDKQDYILGIIEALVFASNSEKSKNTENNTKSK